MRGAEPGDQIQSSQSTTSEEGKLSASSVTPSSPFSSSSHRIATSSHKTTTEIQSKPQAAKEINRNPGIAPETMNEFLFSMGLMKYSIKYDVEYLIFLAHPAK